jgi:phenylpyruvate tautomerase PptA (4-oxalocrotonate tautomerase family)
VTVQPSSSSNDPYVHLRTHAAAQKQETVDRLTRAIAELEAAGRPVTTFTIREVSGLDYMVYYRNRAAFQLFQEHSTHLRKKREQEQAKRQAPSRGSKRKKRKGRESPHAITVSPRDPLLDYKRPRLVQLLHEAHVERDEARADCDEAKKQAQAVQASIKQEAQTERAELEQRYRKLLQEHMQCSVKIAKLEAQVAEYLAFMERFRTALHQEEHGAQP